VSGVSPDALAGHEFVRGLAARYVALLAGAARLAAVQPGHRFFDEGGLASRLWLISSGHVALDLLGPGPQRLIVETIGAGEAIGMSWLAPPFRWQFGAEAIQPTTAFELDTEVLSGLCDADPEFGYLLIRRLMTVAVHRLHATRIRMLDLYASSPPALSRP
jgi:CRP/FNR family transcriptional regulator, cyclic AMP receptor protein